MAKWGQYSRVNSVLEDDSLLTEIEAALVRVRGVAIPTPLLPFRDNAFIKAESLQPTGSFKIRGAYNAMARLTPDERSRGVVTHSSGNHAQAIARAGRLLGIRAVVVMPSTAPQVKVAGVRGDGAEIVFVGPHNEERVARAHEIADRDGMELIPSANHIAVIAGQGTIGFEICEQLLALETDAAAVAAPVVLVPIGLGGLAAGVAAAIHRTFPAARVYGVEPSIAADTRDSLARGERVTWPAKQTSATIADGLRGESPAEIPFAILQRHLAGVIVVEEAEIVNALKVAAREAHLVLEPSGAISLAALVYHRDELPKGPVVMVASGGNVDPQRYTEWLATPD